MVPKRKFPAKSLPVSFRAVLFRMVPKPLIENIGPILGFRAVLFRMVPKQALF